MAVTNLYYRLARVPLESGDTHQAFFSGTTPLASGNSAYFDLVGGLYAFDAVYTGTGHIKITAVGQDASTSVPVNTDITGASPGYQTMYLPPGLYRIELS